MGKVIVTGCVLGAIGPYVQGVDLGSMVLTSGQTPVCPQTGEAAENVSDQTRQSLENVRTIVGSVGSKMSDIAKTIVFVSDLNDLATINQVYQQFFDEHKAIYPTRSRVQATRLLKNVKLKIEAIAVCGDTL